MSKVSFETNKSLAERNFLSRNYEAAMFYYSLALQERPQDKELKIGVLLCDLAEEMDTEAQALFDYYIVSKQENSIDADELMEKLIGSIDDTLSVTSQIMTQPLKDRINAENAISYNDFQEIIKRRGNFKQAFEDIMFSTKVIISEKNEFIDFLEALIANGFHDIALNYLESANAIFPGSTRIRQLYDKIAQKEHIETPDTK